MKSIIVVGAGLSGLSAAYELAHKGYKVQVVEARNRLGGRIWSDRSWGFPVDLGASLVGEGPASLLSPLLKRSGVKLTALEQGSVSYRQKAGKKMGYFETSAGNKLVDKFILEAQKKEKEALTVAELVETLKSGDKTENPLLQDLLSRLEIQFGADPEELSVSSVPRWIQFQQQKTFFLPHGFHKVLDYLADGLEILLQTQVQTIRQSETGVEIQTDEGVLTADACLITVPLGVLKAGKIAFEPALPQEKLEAIHRLGFGPISRVLLHFPEVFWDEETDFIVNVQDETPVFPLFQNLLKLSGLPILAAMTGGSRGYLHDRMNDIQVLQNLSQDLKRLYPNRYRDPVNVKGIRWNADPYCLGGVSFLRNGLPVQDFQILSEPVGRLYFAGEATDEALCGTLAGAYRSGQREAQRMSLKV